MTTRLITPPVDLAVSLDEAKLNLRIDNAELDTVITAWINGIASHAEQYMGRSIITQSWRVTLDSFPSAIRLSNPPIISVQNLNYIDSSGALQTLNPADYVLDNASEPGFIVPAYGKSWPETYPHINTVIVDYTCGYGSALQVPDGIKLYILAKLTEQFDPSVRMEKDTVQASFIDGLLDRFKVYS